MANSGQSRKKCRNYDTRNPQTKAAALAAVDSGEGVRAVGRRLGIPPQRISDWVAGRGTVRSMQEIQDQRALFNRWFVEEAERVVEAALGAMSAKAKDANFAQLASGISCLVEKRQLLSGEPTQRIQTDIDKQQIRDAFFEAAEQSTLTLVEFLQFCIVEAERTGDHELARLLPQIITMEPDPGD